MLPEAENDLICHTGQGTPMGEALRRYWLPCLLITDLPENDGEPVRVKILGEELIAFRDTDGKVGLINERCPHRGASLFFGINQECGIMCIYHGWKFDVNGDCVDMPSDLPGSVFKDKVHINSYPCIESAGMVWTYMGPIDKKPAEPDLIFNRLPVNQVIATRVPVYCNYVQSIEGNIDPSHLGTLHRRIVDWTLETDDTDRPGTPSPNLRSYILAKYPYSEIQVQDTAYGFRVMGIRPTDAGNRHIRITTHVMPVCSMIGSPGRAGGAFIIVPVDDENCMRFFVRHNPDRPFSNPERESTLAENMMMDPTNPKIRLKRADNDYMLDRRVQKTTILAGITPNAEQDYAVTESMGPIYDRGHEHLYAADGGIIRFRQIMVSAAKGIREGIDPPGLDPSIPFHLIRSEETIVKADDDPWLAGADAGESAKPGERIW